MNRRCTASARKQIPVQLIQSENSPCAAAKMLMIFAQFSLGSLELIIPCLSIRPTDV
jgi:hypothetical protein